MPSPARAVTGAVLAVLALTGCSAEQPSASVHQENTSPAAVQPPPAGAVLDYQLGAAYPPPDGVTLVTRDSTASPAAGLYSICYVNGFQSQPADRELWLRQRGHLVLRDDSGAPVADPKWPDELLLDASTEAKRAELAGIVGATVDQCAGKGFQAVEIDNLDSYLRSHGELTADDNLAYAKLLADRAHEKGLAIGQKNSSEQAPRARAEVGFDFAVAEECHRWQECSSYTEVYGPHVVDVEYTDDLRGTFRDVCADRDRAATTTLRDRNLVGPGTPGYAFEHC